MRRVGLIRTPYVCIVSAFIDLFKGLLPDLTRMNPPRVFWKDVFSPVDKKVKPSGLKRSMKAILLIVLFLPVTSFSQCPEWIGSSIEKAEVLKPVLQKYFQGNFKKVVDTSFSRNFQSIKYQIEKEQLLFQIDWYSKKELQGGEVVTLTPVVNDILITGPADRMDRLFSELENIATACSAYSSNRQRVKFSRFVMSCNPGNAIQGIAMKYISIKFFAS